MSKIEDIKGLLDEYKESDDFRMQECTLYVESRVNNAIVELGEEFVEGRLERRWDNICTKLSDPEFFREEDTLTYGEAFEKLYRELLQTVLGFKKFSVKEQSNISAYIGERKTKRRLGYEIMKLTNYIYCKRHNINRITNCEEVYKKPEAENEGMFLLNLKIKRLSLEMKGGAVS